MKKKTVTFLICVIFSLCLCLSACGNRTSEITSSKDPIQIVDGAGREVSFPEPARTVVTSWGGSVNPYLYALGVGDRIIATNNKSGIHQACIPNCNSIPSVGGWKLDKEALAELAPDVYIHGWAASEQLNGANEVGVRSVGIRTNTFEDVADTLLLLGQVFGVEDRAEYVNTFCEKLLSLMESRVGDIPEDEKPGVFVMAEETGAAASDVYDTIEVMVSVAGGKSCVPKEIAEGTDIVNVGLETIFSWNPDYLFLQSVFGELSADEILKDPAWQAVKAAKNGHVYAIPSEFDTWSSASPSSILGALYLSMTMYPEQYADIDFDQTVIEFYKEVYRLDVNMNTLGMP